ncbi:hypothetical protein CPB97_011559 [Podila verticillata]|nr:hypothetical protein CPB97_011559 [Podila verticillata]
MPSTTAALIEGAIFELDDFELDEGDNDVSFDDVQVVPRVHIKSKPRTQRNKAKTATKPEPVCTRSLIFPHEILEYVCEHLSQATLRFCASLVSKQWHVVCNRFIRRVGVWKPLADDYQDALLAKLPKLNALECWAVFDPDMVARDNSIPLSQHRVAWEYFFSKALQSFEHVDQLPPSAPQCLLHHIRDFSVRFKYCDLDTHAAMLSILPGLRLLHTLNIQFEGYSKVALFTVLNNCPFLVNLTVRAIAYNTSHAIHGDAADEIEVPPPAPHTPATGTSGAPVEPPKAPLRPVYLQRYRLTNLTLHGLVINQSVLERVATTCPDLRSFRVYEANKTVWKSGANVTEPLNRSEMMEMIMAQCPKIEWIHLSLCVTSDRLSMDLKTSHCPAHKFLALQCSEHFWSEQLSLSSRAILHDITVLEIPRCTSVTFRPHALNLILRRTPNLQRLDASGVHLDATQLVWEPVPIVPKPKSKRVAKRLAAKDKRKQREARQIAALQAAKAAAAKAALCPFGGKDIPIHWSCQGLRSLRIRTCYQSVNMDDNLFKYLVRYCPLLEELHLWIKHFRIGQIVKFPDVKTARSTSGAAKGRKEHFKETEPERIASNIVLLNDLIHMRHLSFAVSELKGILQPSDFEFMRKKEASGTALDTTVWPHLESFHIRCGEIEIHQSLRSLTSAVHEIRPAVEFRIKKDPSIHLHVWQ